MNAIVGANPDAVIRLDLDRPVALRVQVLSGADGLGPIRVALARVDMRADRILSSAEVVGVDCVAHEQAVAWLHSAAIWVEPGYYVYTVTHPDIPPDATVRVQVGLEEQPRGMIHDRNSLFEGERARRCRLGLDDG